MGDPRWYQAWLDKAAQDKAQGIDISAILNRRIDAQINAKEKANGSAPESGLPELFINESDPTETAKELAILIARRGDLLSNGVVPVRIVADSNNYPLALELGVDGVRVVAHEVCQPVKYPLKPGRRKNGAEPKEVRKENRADQRYC